MTDIGRNAPCPCGSGKKFKHCHLNQPVGGRPHPAGATSQRLTTELMQAMPSDEREWAIDAFTWLPDQARALGELPPEPEPSIFVPWALYVSPGPTGRTLAARHLERHRARLTPLERELLEAEARTPVSIWEVVEVRRGEGFTGRNLLTHEERFVRDVGASNTVIPRAVILVRVVDVAGEGMLSGTHPNILSPSDAEKVVAIALKTLKRRKLPLAPTLVADPMFGVLLLHAWRFASRPKPPPTLVNTDGESLENTTDRFRFAPAVRDELLRLLEREDRVQREDDGDEAVFVFTVPANARIKDWDNTLVGRVFVGRAALRIETNSRRRADLLRQRVEKALGARVTFTGRESKAVEVPPPESPAKLAPPLEAVPPPEAVRALQEMKQAHYGTWPDEEIPALGGRTPRQAVKTAAGRRQVETMLRDFEFREAQRPPYERFDFGPIRVALGLA